MLEDAIMIIYGDDVLCHCGEHHVAGRACPACGRKMTEDIELSCKGDTPTEVGIRDNGKRVAKIHGWLTSDKGFFLKARA